MSSTILDADRFIEEVKKWGITPSSRHKVRAMEKGKYFYFRFAIPDTSEIIETQIIKEEYEKFSFVNLAGLTVPAIWENEIALSKKLIEQMEVLNAKLTTIPRRDSQGNKLEFT